MNAVKPKPHTFAEMESALVQARVGDTVSVVLTLGHKPTRYQVIDEDGDTLYLQGKNGAECKMTAAAAEQTVWLERLTGRLKRNRRVVQASVDPRKAAAQTDTDRLRAELAGKALEIAGLRSSLQAAIRAKGLDDDRLTAKSYELEECRIALGQLYNVAHARHPGDSPLPPGVNPSSVVIDVMAAMLWHSRVPERTPIRVPPLDTYRSAIAKSLPDRMQNEKSA